MKRVIRRISGQRKVLLTALMLGGIFSTSGAFAACTVGATAIDGLASGTSVNCPTGTVNGGTVPPDGSTIDSKNVSMGPTETTFQYTKSDNSLGSVRFNGTVTLTAATTGGGGSNDDTAQDTQELVNDIVNQIVNGGGNEITTLLNNMTPEQRQIFGLQGQLATIQTELRVLYFDIAPTRNSISVARQTIQIKTLEIADIQHDPDLSPEQRQQQTAAKIREIDAVRDDIKQLEEKVRPLQERADKLAEQGDRIEAQLKDLNRPIFEIQLPFSLSINGFDLRRARAGEKSGALRSFSTSFKLSGLLNRLAAAGMGDSGSGRGSPLPKNLDIVGRISYSGAENGANNAGYVSRSLQGAFGFDYRLSDKIGIGLVSAFTSNTTKTDGAGSESDSFSYLMGPLVRVRPIDNVTISASFSAGPTYTDLTVNGATSDFESFQTLSTLGVSAAFATGNWTIAPSVSGYFTTSDTDAFTDSAGNFTASRTSESGSISLGPTVSYTYLVAGNGPLTLVTPSLRISGDHKLRITVIPGTLPALC